MIDLADLLAYIGNQRDYDVSKQRPQPGPYVKREGEPPTTYLTRLEDIDDSWVSQYVRDVIIGYKRNASGRSKHMAETRTNLTYHGEDGELIDSADLEVDYDNTSGYDIITAKSKLPHLLKRLHMKSKILRTSLISIYGVYLLEKRHAKGLEVKPGAMLNHTIWRMNPDGSITSSYGPNANHNSGFPQAFAFVKGSNPEDPFYKDLQEFGQVCEALGILLWYEDAKQFDQKFIDSLLVTYIRSNSDFMWGGKKKDTNVLTALQDTSRHDWSVNSGITYNDVDVQSALVRLTDTRSPECITLYNGLMKETDVNYFFFLYNKVSGDKSFVISARVFKYGNPHRATPNTDVCVPTLSCLSEANGFICLPGTATPYVFDVTKICLGYQRANALLHKSGHLFLITQSNTTKYVHITEATKYLQYKVLHKDSPLGATLENGSVCGRWYPVRL